MQNIKIHYDDSELKFLEFIQNIIARMNNNSFSIKQMSVTLLAAAFALYISTKNLHIFFISFLPIIVFYFLDAYYLWQERIFRKFYTKAIKKEVPLFVVDTSGVKVSYCKVLVSKSIALFYFGLILLNFLFIGCLK